MNQRFLNRGILRNISNHRSMPWKITITVVLDATSIIAWAMRLYSGSTFQVMSEEDQPSSGKSPYIANVVLASEYRARSSSRKLVCLRT